MFVELKAQCDVEVVTIFIGSMMDKPTIEHLGNPFTSQASCEAELPKQVGDAVTQNDPVARGRTHRPPFQQRYASRARTREACHRTESTVLRAGARARCILALHRKQKGG